MSAKRDDIGPPIGALPIRTIELAENDTDVTVFDDLTKRRCANCGIELHYDDSAYQDGVVDTYLLVREWMVANGISSVSAARMIEQIRNQNRSA